MNYYCLTEYEKKIHQSIGTLWIKNILSQRPILTPENTYERLRQYNRKHSVDRLLNSVPEEWGE